MIYAVIVTTADYHYCISRHPGLTIIHNMWQFLRSVQIGISSLVGYSVCNQIIQTAVCPHFPGKQLITEQCIPYVPSV